MALSLPPPARWQVRSGADLPEPPELKGLLEPGVDALPVRVVIQQDDFVTGWDDGAMGFEDDAVWFSGRATSFRVFAEDVASPVYARRDVEAMTAARLLHAGFPLRHPSRRVAVRAAILSLPERKDWEDEARLVEGMRRLWLGSGATRTTETTGESQYPPLALRPGARPLHAPSVWSTENVAGLDALARANLRKFCDPFAHPPGIDRLVRAIVQEEG